MDNATVTRFSKPGMEGRRLRGFGSPRMNSEAVTYSQRSRRGGGHTCAGAKTRMTRTQARVCQNSVSEWGGRGSVASSRPRQPLLRLASRLRGRSADAGSISTSVLDIANACPLAGACSRDGVRRDRFGELLIADASSRASSPSTRNSSMNPRARCARSGRRSSVSFALLERLLRCCRPAPVDFGLRDARCRLPFGGSDLPVSTHRFSVEYPTPRPGGRSPVRSVIESPRKVGRIVSRCIRASGSEADRVSVVRVLGCLWPWRSRVHLHRMRWPCATTNNNSFAGSGRSAHLIGDPTPWVPRVRHDTSTAIRASCSSC